MKSLLPLLLCTLACSTPALANSAELKPGQWSMSVSMQMAGMPQLSADQLAQMKQLGVDLPMLSGKPTVVPQCITPEQAALKKPITPTQNPDDQCSVQNYRQSGKTVSGDMVCSGDLKAKGHFEMTVTSATSYSGKWTLQGVTSGGQAINQSSDIKATWIKDKCDANVVANP